MMRVAIAIATIFIASAAWAGNAVESIDMTNAQARELFIALSNLDGYDRVVKDGASEKVAKTPYQFGGGFRLAVGRNLAAAKSVVDPFDTAQKALFLQYANGADKLSGDAQVKFSTELDKLLAAHVRLELVKFKSDELKLNDNPIPGTVIQGLQPILVE